MLKNPHNAQRPSRDRNLSWRRGWILLFGLTLIFSLNLPMLSANTIASFEDPDALEDWAIVNDTVMGGVSRSSIEQTEAGNLLFKGDLSLRNNGGFVSIRNRPGQLTLQGATGIALSVRGPTTSTFELIRKLEPVHSGHPLQPSTTSGRRFSFN
jgi:hypothetical protein